jgi:hypothetical protein
MATESGLSKSTMGRIWKAFGFKLHQVDTFKMKKTIIAIYLALLFCALCWVSAAQEQSKARDLYLSFGKTANKSAKQRRGRPSSRVKMELGYGNDSGPNSPHNMKVSFWCAGTHCLPAIRKLTADRCCR